MSAPVLRSASILLLALAAAAPSSRGLESAAERTLGFENPAVTRSPRLQRLRQEIGSIMEETRPLLQELRSLQVSYLEKPGFWSRSDRREALRASLRDRIGRLVALEDEWNSAIEEHRSQAALAALQGLMGGGDPARAGADYAFFQGGNDFAARALTFRHSLLNRMEQEQVGFELMRSLQKKRLIWFSTVSFLLAALGTGFLLFVRKKA